MTKFLVASSSPKNHEKRVTVEDKKGGRIHLKMHRYALVGKGDLIYIDPIHPSRISIVSQENPEVKIPLTPHFEQSDRFKIGSTEYQLRINEIATPVDLENYIFLEKFHYKTSSAMNASDIESDGPAQPTGGSRKGVLLIYLKLGLRWQAVGYIELHMPLLMVKPRHKAFNAHFAHPSRPIAWAKWDQDSLRKYVNTIVRVARVVVSPEFRGLGLTKIALRVAKKYSQERWHIRGIRPLFIEVLAEMLKYMNFVSSSGFHYLGDTEGNLKRVHKDLTYMQKDYDISSGIMSLQKKYLTKIKDGSKLLNRTMEETMQQLNEITINANLLDTLNSVEWCIFKSVLRLPMPYFVCGLDDYTENYISRVSKPFSSKNRFSNASEAKIKIKGLSATSKIQISQTRSVRAIMECFGLEGEAIESSIFGPIDIEASGGNIFFISGPSGSGKSILLKILDPDFSSKYLEIKSSAPNESNYIAGWMKDIKSDLPLIEYFSEKWGIERSIAALNQAGLSEAFIYLKPYKILSRGQKYRARLAELALGPAQVWLLDEFCSDLDPLTAKIVASNLRKHVLQYRRIAFVAAANNQHYLDALRPTRVIALKQGAKPEILTYKDYVDEFYAKSI